MALNYLKRRGSTYYARMAVPTDLREVLGTTELAKSLGTRDQKEAKRLLRPVVDAWERHFDELRARKEFTAAEAQAAVWDHYTGELEADDASCRALPSAAEIDAATGALMAKADRGELPGDDPLALLDATLDVQVMHEAGKIAAEHRAIKLTELRKHAASGETALIAHATDEAIAKRRLLIKPVSDQHRDLGMKLMRAEIESLQRTAERDRGNFTGKPADPLVRPPTAEETAVAKPGETIMELFEQYALENPENVSSNTITQARRDIGTFLDVAGRSIPVTGIDKKAVREWKALLLRYPVKATEQTIFRDMSMREIVKANEKIGKPVLNPKTVNRYLASLGAFCNWLAAHDYLPANPLKDMYIKVDKTKTNTLTFTTRQLNTLFAAPLFTGCLSDKKWDVPGQHKIRDHRFWTPIVMLYSGARPGEIAQLLVDDVRQQDGIWFMHITDEGDDTKSIKTKGSFRVVPIHSELIRLGFIEFHQRAKAKGQARLFPEAERNDAGMIAAAFNKKFGLYLTKLGIKDGRGISLYSLRHGFADAMRRADYLDEQFGFLMGHSRFSMTNRYGQLPQGMLRTRAEMIEKVTYPGLELIF